jgi:hypothetical protein
MSKIEIIADEITRKSSRTFGKYAPDSLFENLDRNVRDVLCCGLEAAPGKPLVAFYFDESRWTVLTDINLVWKNDGKRNEISLLELYLDYDVTGDTVEATKEDCNWVTFPANPDKIWAPTARLLSLLLNVLGAAIQRNLQRNRIVDSK